MRKTLIALILVLPMAFVLVIFSSVNVVSLGVNIAVNGIEIHAEGTDAAGSLFLDMADATEHIVTAEVKPSNATDKGYAFSSDREDVVQVTREGKIVPRSEGTAIITATSNDKSFTDSMSVVVVSSKPYDFDFTLCEADGVNLLKETEGGYEATINAGTYSYGMTVFPTEYTQYKISHENDLYAEIERGTKNIFLPFTGDAEFSVTVPDGVKGDIKKSVLLHVKNPVPNGVLINGNVGDDFSGVQLAFGTTETQLFVECAGGRPSFSSDHAILKGITGTNGRYILDIGLDGNAEKELSATVTAGGRTYRFLFSFTEFAFTVTSDRTIESTDNGDMRAVILTGSPALFYAVASAGAKGVAYSWQFDGPNDYITVEDNMATVKATKGGEFTLSVTAIYGEMALTHKIVLSVIDNVSSVLIKNDVKTDLAANFTVAGLVYDDNFAVQANSFPLVVYTYSTSGLDLAGDNVVYSVSNENIAKVEMKDGTPVLVPKGTGEVTVTAAWKYNAAFDKEAVALLTLNVINDAVAVKNAPELMKAMEEKRPAVLASDIKLGTGKDGTVLSTAEREAILSSHRMKSTYNIEWYKNDSEANESDAYISYVLEFTNSVYGNGKSIDADNFTHYLDGNGKPLFNLYRGPLYFVKYKQMASVAGQDNCAFLIRTDGIKLYGVNLLGCSDESLKDQSAEGNDLTNLNLTGTTLEVNANCEIVNCRIKNGRNVVRVYGGNRDGNKYFIDSLGENSEGVDKERIKVKIDGCILSQGREFLLKIGANRALRASKMNGQEPPLRDKTGKAYSEQGASNRYENGELYKDDWFYKQYVMTDVTLKDSVLETSGLFTVGIESNFSGKFLFDGAGDHQYSAFTKGWEKSGGTSFASVLRLEGDVRLYDWKSLDLIDSSTLIESPVGALSEWLKLDIKGMLDFVSKKDSTNYGNVLETTSDGKQYVHGGIALYGGGRNYSEVDMSGLNESLKDFMHMNINISILHDGTGSMQQQGELLPQAAGTHDFNFYMYGKDSANNYASQNNTREKYKGVKAVPLF